MWLRHPPYYPNLASSGYCQFPKLKNCLGTKIFDSNNKFVAHQTSILRTSKNSSTWEVKKIGETFEIEYRARRKSPIRVAVQATIVQEEYHLLELQVIRKRKLLDKQRLCWFLRTDEHGWVVKRIIHLHYISLPIIFRF